MIKMTKKQIDNLFISMAHDLYSKFEENVEIIQNSLLSIPFDALALRLYVEFIAIYTENDERREKRNAAKSETKKKVAKKKESGRTTSKLVRTKKE